MKTLSIMQPWAWLIVNGHKDIENRDWSPTNYGLKFRGKFLVHAGKKIDSSRRDYGDFWNDIWTEHRIPMPPYDELQTGGIVGMSEILDVVDEHKSPWFFGPKGLVLGRSRVLPFMPYKGQLGFFDVQYDKRLLGVDTDTSIK